MTTQSNDKQEKDRQLAGKRQQSGLEAYHEGKLDKAAEAFGDAQRPVSEASSSLALGHVERQLTHLDRAQDAYQYAQQLFRTASYTAGLGSVELALGHIELQRGRTDYAAEH